MVRGKHFVLKRHVTKIRARVMILNPLSGVIYLQIGFMIEWPVREIFKQTVVQKRAHEQFIFYPVTTHKHDGCPS